MVHSLANKAEFQDALAKNAVAVVDFTAQWCGPCKMIAPKYEEMSLENPTIAFFKLDVDDVADVAEMSGIRAMPTFHVYKNGEKVAEVVGANLQKLKEALAAL